MTKSGQEKSHLRINRRQLLKATATMGALTTLSETSRGKREQSVEKLAHGKYTVVNAKITHPNADTQIPRMAGGGGIRRTHPEKGRLFVVSAPLSEIVSSKSHLLRTPFEEYIFNSSVKLKQRRIYEEITYGGSLEYQLDPIEKYTPFQIDIEVNGKTAIATLDGKEILKVSPKTEATALLPDQEVSIRVNKSRSSDSNTRDRRTVSVTPQLTIRNDGELTVFGAEDAMTVPRIGNPAIQHVLEGALAHKDKFEVIPWENGAAFTISQQNTEVDA